MYKKITHKIFEEQFAHPAIINPMPNTDIKSKMVDNTIVNTLRRQVRDIMVHYAGRMRDTMIAITNGTADQELAAQLAGSEANKLAEIYGKYYPVNETSTFTREFGIITSTTIEMAKAKKNGTDIEPFATQNANSILAFAGLTGTMNGGWMTDDIIMAFTEITNNWVGQVDNRMKSNWSTDFRLAGKNESYLVSGTSMLIAYTDSFVTGISMSFPAQF